MKLSFASRGKFMLIIWPFKLSELRRPILKDQAFEPEEKRFKLDKAITPTKHHSNWEILNSFNYTEPYDWWSFHLLYFACCIKYFSCESILSQIYYTSLLYILISLCCRCHDRHPMIWTSRNYVTTSCKVWEKDILSREKLTMKTITSGSRAQIGSHSVGIHKQARI